VAQENGIRRGCCAANAANIVRAGYFDPKI
jgi:hypothetical protein